MFRRMWAGDIAILAASWISGDRSLKVARSRLYTVGTTVKKVIFGFEG